MMFNNEWDLTNVIDISKTKLAESILRLRKIDNLEKFLYPKLSDLNDPYLVKDMDKAVERIIEAIENQELILIYGDYDTDGITATAIMYRFLEDNGAYVNYYIPKREEGYGLSIDVLKNILNEEIGLIITVDCGIPSFEAVDFINEIGIDCIISDHHTPQSRLPAAYCIISPKISDQYPFSDLCGAGIAFKIIQALCIKLDLGSVFARYIDLAALGTIADVVPLKDENRIIAKIGMDSIASTDNIGLRELLKQSYPYGFDKINSAHLMFNIIPKINASGRMDTAEHAITLLLSDDIDECKVLSEKLIRFNEERKVRQKEITESVINAIDNNDDLKNDLVLVLADNDWDLGILGLAASHIVEKYNRPCILFGYDRNNVDSNDNKPKLLKGSGRSVENFNLFSALEYCGDDLQITYGGHKIAAGNMIDESKLSKFRDKINEYARSIGFSVSEHKIICPDFRIDIEDINVENAQILSCMEPYGCENELSKFFVENLKLKNIQLIGKTKDHLSLSFIKNGKYINCISFNSAVYKKLFSMDASYDIIFKMSLNTVRDSNSEFMSERKFVNCEIIDVHMRELKSKVADSLIKYIKTDAKIDRNSISETYKYIKKSSLPIKLQLEDIPDIPQFLICLDILQELGIIKYNNIGYKFIFINELNDKIKKDLNASSTYMKIMKGNKDG